MRADSRNLRSLLSGEGESVPAVMLWQHVYVDDPRRLADATVSFYRRYGLAAAKIMPDIPLLFHDHALSSWRQVSQLRNITKLGRSQDYIATVRHTRGLLEPDDELLVTVFSPLALLGMWCGPEVFDEIAQAAQAGVHAVLGELAEGVARLARACTAAGADGVYYSCWGQDLLGVDGYREFGVPYDLAGLEGARSCEMRLLHLHGGKGIDLRTFAEYPAEIIGWSELDTGIGLSEGADTLNGKIPMGGINERPAAPLSNTTHAIRENLLSVSAMLGGRFVAAPGCSLPDDLNDTDIEALRATAALDGAQ